MNKNDIKRFTFRIPTDLFLEIEKIAKNNYRSVNAEINIAIKEYIKNKIQNSSKEQEL